MADVEATRLGPRGCRFLLRRESRGVTCAAERERDVTGRVVRCGWLEERGQGTPGVVAAPSLRVELLPDEELRREGGFWSGPYELRDINLRVEGAGGVVFDGVLAALPQWRYEVAEEGLTLFFVGRVSALWGDTDLDLSEGEDGFEWGHALDDVLPALLARSVEAPPSPECDEIKLSYREPFWSHYGPVPLPRLSGDVKAAALAWDAGRRLLYVGAGEFVLSFSPHRRRWEIMGRIQYQGRDEAARNTPWQVARLEYDDKNDRLLGLAESADPDVRKTISHLKIPFALGL